MSYCTIVLIYICIFFSQQDVLAARRNKTRILAKTEEDQLPEISLGAVGVLENPDCTYRILQNGTEVRNANVGQDVYHEISCNSSGSKLHEDYCLMVFNCTIANEDRSIQQAMIDETGCTLEPLIFEDVEYNTDMKAGIRAQAIRFHGSPKVQLHCQTRLLIKGKVSCKDRRPNCLKNEYFLASALKVNTPPR